MLDGLYFQIGKLIQQHLESIDGFYHEDYEKVESLMLDEVKYVKNFYHCETGELIEKLEAGFMLMRLYQ